MEVHVHTSPEWLLPVLCTFITRIPEKARTGPRKTLWSLTCFSVVHELHGWPCGLDFLRLKCLQVCKYRMHDDGLSFVICVGMQFCVIWCRTSRPAPENSRILGNMNTSRAEILNSVLGRHRFTIRPMRKLSREFLVLEIVDSRNRCDYDLHHRGGVVWSWFFRISMFLFSLNSWCFGFPLKGKKSSFFLI